MDHPPHLESNVQPPHASQPVAVCPNEGVEHWQSQTDGAVDVSEGTQVLLGEEEPVGRRRRKGVRRETSERRGGEARHESEERRARGEEERRRGK